MKINKELLIAIDILLLIITVVVYKFIFEVETNKTVYAEESSKFAEDSENPVFKLKKIVLWSSAHAVDNSDGELKDIDISQFTDIEIYIDNLSKVQELTPENTINQMYIDNIKIDTNELNRDIRFNYKNPYNCGKYEELENYQGEINYKIINTNKKQTETNYEESVFFTDCSNPITLGYVNKDFMTNCEIGGESGLINFDGSILSKVVPNLQQLDSKISFDLHLVNNYNEKFICKVEIDIDLTDNNMAIDSGYLNKEIVPTAEDKLIFFKQY